MAGKNLTLPAFFYPPPSSTRPFRLRMRTVVILFLNNALHPRSCSRQYSAQRVLSGAWGWSAICTVQPFTGSPWNPGYRERRLVRELHAFRMPGQACGLMGYLAARMSRYLGVDETAISTRWEYRRRKGCHLGVSSAHKLRAMVKKRRMACILGT